MKKILTFCAAVLASVSMWAAYAPTADEVIILNNVYDANATDAGYSKHAAIAWGGTASTNSKKAGDPNNNGDATSSNVNCYSTKGNGAGKNITVSIAGCSQIIVYHEKHSSRYVELRAGSKTGDLIGKGEANTYYTAVDLNANNSYSIFLHGTTGSDDQDFNVYAVKLIKGETCTDPEAHLAFTKSTAYVGEQFSYDYGSKSGGDLNDSYTLNGVPAVKGTDYTFTSGNITVLKAGQFVMHMTVAAREGYCAADLSDTILINEATPVTEVTIDGPDAAYVGEAVTFTATAANASDYAWTVNGVDANTNAAEFTYTPAAAGEYSIVCSARNKFNAAEEWIASEAKVLTASNVSGELVSYTVNSDANGAENLTGALAAKATAKVSLTKGSSQALDEYTGYKMDRGKYVGVTLTSGKFAEGDTVSFMVTKASGTAKLYLYDDEQGTNRLDSIDFSGQTGWATFVLNQATAGVYLYRSNPDVKPYDQNPFVAALKVIRPKAVDHADVSLVGVTIDGEALPSSFVTDLINNGTFTILDSYVNAPVVTFVKHTDTYYEGETEPVSTNDSIKVTATEFEGKWLAQATIGENTYTITLAKAASFTVHYMDGTTELGTENVAANGTPANYLLYQSKSLAAFVGWYQDVNLTVEANMNAPITAETYLYAKFENKYAESVNIEKLILENSKGYDIITNVLNGTNGYASNYTASSMDITNDSLNDAKGAMRNYAYLGLKIKSKSLLNCRVAEGQTILIKFGNLGTTPQVSVNGSAYAAMPITNGVCTYTATGDDLLSMYVPEDGKAVVLKQIMIGEAPALEDVVYDITCAEAENGTLACDWAIALPGETVKLNVTPAEGYKIAAVTVNGETVEAVEGAYSFIMPAAAAAVSATFVEDTASALGNTEAEAKAVKVVRDGQLLILKNGILYNAQGAIVK